MRERKVVVGKTNIIISSPGGKLEPGSCRSFPGRSLSSIDIGSFLAIQIIGINKCLGYNVKFWSAEEVRLVVFKGIWCLFRVNRYFQGERYRIASYNPTSS